MAPAHRVESRAAQILERQWLSVAAVVKLLSLPTALRMGHEDIVQPTA